MEQTRQQDAERGKQFLKSLDERIARGGYGARDLQELRGGIGDTHKTVSDRDHAEAIGRDIRTGQGFTKWPHAQHLVGDLLQPKAEPMHSYQRSGAAAGASYKPESQRTRPEEWLPKELLGREGLREAIGRGAILSKAPEPPPAPHKSNVQRFLDNRTVAKHDKEAARCAEFITKEPPRAVKERDEAASTIWGERNPDKGRDRDW